MDYGIEYFNADGSLDEERTRRANEPNFSRDALITIKLDPTEPHGPVFCAEIGFWDVGPEVLDDGDTLTT